jgi:tight adherence protein B
VNGVALVLLLAVLVLLVVGIVDLERGNAQNRTLLERSALDAAEARSRRLRTRFDLWVRQRRWGQRVAGLLASSSVGVSAGDAVLLLLVGGSFAFLVIDRLAGPLFGALAVVGVVLFGRSYLRRQIEARREEFIGQLPELARTLSNAASAGLALRSAIAMAADELADPAGAELKVIRERMAVGMSLDDALGALEQRLPSRELRLLVTTLVIQSRSGGALVSALQGMSETLEARKDLRRELHTLTAGAVYTGYLVGLVGVGVLLLVNAISPGALKIMSGSLVGQASFAVAGGLFALGLFLIKRSTTIDV